MKNNNFVTIIGIVCYALVVLGVITFWFLVTMAIWKYLHS
jgi:hypothetical protein